jgi:hypothetical protein
VHHLRTPTYHTLGTPALLAATFLATGLLKLLRPINALAPVLGDWVHDVPAPLVRTIATLEIAGAVGCHPATTCASEQGLRLT